MTDCASVRRFLYPYLDHEVNPAERDKIDVHLTGCSACQELFASERQFLALLKRHLATPPVSPPSGRPVAIEVQLPLPLTESEPMS